MATPQPQLHHAPGPRPNFLGGHFWQFRRDPIGFFQKATQEYGDVSHFRMGPQHAFFANHPDLVKDILVTNHAKFHKGRALQRAKTLLGAGLLTSEEAFHLRQRRLVQPAFHRQRLQNYGAEMVAAAEKMRDSWRDGAQLDAAREMMRLTLAIVGRTLFSADVEGEADEVGAAMTTLIEMFDLLLMPFSEILEKLPLGPSRRFQQARARLDATIYRMIIERRRSGADTGDLLSMLLLAQDEESDGGMMTDQQVRDECLTLFLAGHETTANALTFTWYLLSQHPEIEAKFHAELDEALAGRVPSFADFPRLRYTEMILSESMRLYPPAWALGRLAVADHELNGYHIPKGSLILLSMFVAHRDPRFWPDAEQFIPERWLPENKEKMTPYTYFPFGGGVRRCIGEGFAWLEGVLLLATLGQRWRLRVAPGHQVEPQPRITLRLKGGLPVMLERRKS
jgi:cytochrome P450